MKLLLVVFSFCFFIYSSVAGQDLFTPDKRPIPTFLIKRGYEFPDSVKRNHFAANHQWPDTLYYNTAYKSKLLGSLTIPISFSNIELSHGNYLVSPTISLGIGYTWFFGDFIFNENDKITVDPTFYFGLIANAGLENNFSFNKLAGFFTGGFIGVGAFTLFGGYDVINKSPSLGVGGRIDFYTVSQKFLHVIGKVHEVRKHKSIAPKITGE
ncbi:MAG TPA: hypothetical protein VK808_01190 [Bacteroidia bacterium]|nr:hypothetical protein [Bacteroidia bacterium]